MSTLQVSSRGTLQPDGITLLLESKLALSPGPVSVIVEQAKPRSEGPTLLEVLERIHREQAERGEPGMTREQMDAEIAEMRDDEEYEERWRRIYANTTPHTPVTE